MSKEMRGRNQIDFYPMSCNILALVSLCQDDGGWFPNDYGGPMFLLPGLVIMCEITGTEIETHRKRCLLRSVCIFWWGTSSRRNWARWSTCELCLLKLHNNFCNMNESFLCTERALDMFEPRSVHVSSPFLMWFPFLAYFFKVSSSFGSFDLVHWDCALLKTYSTKTNVLARTVWAARSMGVNITCPHGGGGKCGDVFWICVSVMAWQPGRAPRTSHRSCIHSGKVIYRTLCLFEAAVCLSSCVYIVVKCCDTSKTIRTPMVGGACISRWRVQQCLALRCNTWLRDC